MVSNKKSLAVGYQVAAQLGCKLELSCSQVSNEFYMLGSS